MCDPEIEFLKKKFESELNAKQQQIDFLREQYANDIRNIKDIKNQEIEFLVEYHKIELEAKEYSIKLLQEYADKLKTSYILKIRALEEDCQSKIDNKDEQMNFYKDELEKARNRLLEIAKRPIIINNIDNRDQSREVNISGGTVNASGAGSINLGEISGMVGNTISKLPTSSPDSDEPGIRELLAELQQAIAQESELEKKGKAKAFKLLQTLAEASLMSNSEEAKEYAEDSTTLMTKVVSGLPETAALLISSKSILPSIATYFGFDLPLWF